MEKNKKGFVTVYICLFFMALTSMMLLLIGGTKAHVYQNNASTLSRLWAQSILAEYDLNLEGRYHLFGFYGYPAEVKRKLTFYSNESFANESNISYEVISCSLYAYSLRNIDIFKKQVIEAGKFSLSEHFDGTISQVIPVENHQQEETESLFEGLPSADHGTGMEMGNVISLLNRVTSLEGIIERGTESFFENAYIFAHFKDNLDDRQLGGSYFSGEIEYILCGKKSDRANEKTLKNKIIAVREAMNLIYLNQDETKRAEALAVAEFLTPGAGAAVTQQTLLALWALAESHNDYKLLLAGHQIPLMKNDATWAVDLESAMANTEEGHIYTGVDEGNDYEDYLRIFMYLTDEEVKLLRAMDLIQINFRWLYYSDFLLSDYHGGVEFTYSINGKNEEVKLCYE